METLFLSAAAQETAQTAAELIRAGELVAIPTETVYGLGANGMEASAVAKIFLAKGRPQDNPLILHISDATQMQDICRDIPPQAWMLAERFWPGPLTMVLPAREHVPTATRAGLPSVAVRCPDSAITRQIIRLAGVPVAAPSANISGKPSTTTAEHVRHDHDGRIAAIVDDGPCRVGVESTIVDLTGQTARLLRPGGVTLEQLREVLGEIIVDKAVTASVDHDAVVKAPGMKYRHYAPDCQVLIVDGDVLSAVDYVKKHWKSGNRVLCFQEELELFAPYAPLAYGVQQDPDSLLAGLFAALRELDDPSIGTVFARCPTGSGKAMAVQNRLGKAAAFQHVNPRQRATVLGITGGTGCGKTTLLQVIRSLGGVVLDCDAIYHQLLQSDMALLCAIQTRFPGVVEDGQLQRKKLGQIVFTDAQALEDLNRITHAAVKTAVLEHMPKEPSLVAIDAIGLFEGGLAELCDITVAVTAPVEERVQRLMQREGISREYARKRIEAQRSNEEFSAMCNQTLENNGDLCAFQAKCLAFLKEFGIM